MVAPTGVREQNIPKLIYKLFKKRSKNVFPILTIVDKKCYNDTDNVAEYTPVEAAVLRSIFSSPKIVI